MHTKTNVEVVLQHGWGFSPLCWQNWIEKFDSHKNIPVTVRVADRGYFGDPCQPRPFRYIDSLRVVVAHSFGLHLLPAWLISEANLVVIFGGSTSVEWLDLSRVPNALVAQGNVPSARQQKLELFADYYSKCFSPDQPELKYLGFRGDHNLGTERLKEDLTQIAASSISTALLSGADKVLVLHGREDAVVPFERGKELAAALPNATFLPIDSAGHCLPFQHTGLTHLIVWEQIEQLLETSHQQDDVRHRAPRSSRRITKERGLTWQHGATARLITR